MSERSTGIISFDKIEIELPIILKEHHYRDATIKEYMRLVQAIKKSVDETDGKKRYSKYIGEQWLASVNNVGYSNRYVRANKLLINRLNDMLDDLPYRKNYHTSVFTVASEYEEIYKAYVSHINSIGLAKETIRSKTTNARKFFNNLSEIGCLSISDINASVVLKVSLLSTVATYPTTIKSILNYLLDKGLIKADYSSLIGRVRNSQPSPTVYSKEEIRKIENYPNTEHCLGKRNKAIILLTTRNGLRAGNVSALRFSDVDFENNIMHLRQVKTYDAINPILLKEVKDALLDYIDNGRPCIDSEYIFLSANAPHTPIHSNCIYGVIHQAIIGSGISINGRRCGPHSMRSSLNSAAVNNGFTYEEMSIINGHKGVHSMMNYVKLDDSKLRLCALEVTTPTGFFDRFLRGEEVIDFNEGSNFY